MVSPAQHSDTEPRPSIQSSQSSQPEQQIADAVVAAIRHELEPIKNTQEQQTKILRNIQQELRDVNKILASAGLILDNPDI